MMLNIRLRTILGLFAAFMTIFNLLAMTPVAAAPRQHCVMSKAEEPRHHDERSKAQTGCCDSMHCCPVLSELPSPDEPLSLRYRPLARLLVEEPLLLVTSIDPPPRSADS